MATLPQTPNMAVPRHGAGGKYCHHSRGILALVVHRLQPTRIPFLFGLHAVVVLADVADRCRKDNPSDKNNYRDQRSAESLLSDYGIQWLTQATAVAFHADPEVMQRAFRQPVAHTGAH